MALPLTPLFIFIKLFQSFWVQSAQIKYKTGYRCYICSQGQRFCSKISKTSLHLVVLMLWKVHICYAVPGSYNQGGSELGIVESIATYSLAPRDWRLILNGSEFSIWILKGN